VTGVDGLENVLSALKQLDKDATVKLRADNKDSATMLAEYLRGAAAGASAPQAKRFAWVIGPRSDRLVSVVARIGAADYVKPMAVFHGTEYGSNLKRFHTAPASGGRWFWPTVRRRKPAIIDRWRNTVHRLVAEANSRIHSG
jgi:hypothetical protein